MWFFFSIVELAWAEFSPNLTFFPGDALASTAKDGRGVGHWRVALAMEFRSTTRWRGVLLRNYCREHMWPVGLSQSGGRIVLTRQIWQPRSTRSAFPPPLLAFTPCGSACRVGSLEATPRSLDGRSAQNCRYPMEEFSLSLLVPGLPAFLSHTRLGGCIRFFLGTVSPSFL